MSIPATPGKSESLNPTRMAAACPLCGKKDLQVVEQLNGQQLRALWQELGHELTAEAWDQIHPQFIVALQRCRDCGFKFFEPSLAGNEAFYRQLEYVGYFSSGRPEFSRTVELARQKGLKRVLDVGCGSGAFLDLAREAGCETCGLELNSVAVEKARAKGHKIFNRLLHE